MTTMAAKPLMLKDFLELDSNYDDPAPIGFDRYTHSMRHLLEAELRRCSSATNRQLIRSRSKNAFLKLSSLIKLDFLLLSCSPKSANKKSKSRSRNPLKKKGEDVNVNVRVKDIVKLRSFSLPPAPAPASSSSSSSGSWSESEFNGSEFLASSNGSSEFMPDVVVDKCSPVRTEAGRGSPRNNNKAVIRSESSTAGSCNSEEEEKDQLSPVSIMDFPYEEEEEEEDDVQTEEEDAFHANLAVIERAKQALLQKLRRFESLAELVPVDLNSQFSDADEEEEECSITPSSNNNDEINEQESNTTEMQAWKLLDQIKSISSVKIEGSTEKLLVEFLLEGLHIFPQEELVNAVRRWVGDESECWERQQERRVEMEVDQMERNGRWRSCVEEEGEEKRELAECLGNGVFGSLMDELVRELVLC